MSSEAVLFAILFTLIIPVVLGLFAWILKELINLTKLVTILSTNQIGYGERIRHLEDAVFPPHRSSHG